MSVKGFKFISPGVFINEIDNSFLPSEPDAIGPVIIGRASQGIAMTPTKVSSYEEFVNNYGTTVPGQRGGDVYRDGNLQSPMYGTYAAKAFLQSEVAPVNYLRLLGQQTTTNDGTHDAMAGWRTNIGTPPALTTPIISSTIAGGAYGLFIAASSSTNNFTGASAFQLGAIIYVNSGSVQLGGTLAGDLDPSLQPPVGTGSCLIVKTNSDGNFDLFVDGATNGLKKFSINFNNENENFIRKRLNTNPQLTSPAGTFYNTEVFEDYYLGETFEQFMRDNNKTLGNSAEADGFYGVIVGIASGSTSTIGPHNMKNIPSQEAISGWFIGQDLGAAASYHAENAQKLFRLIGRGHGEWLSKNAKVSIEQLRASNTTSDDYGTFSLVIRPISSVDTKADVLERFDNLTLDPTSPNYIARRIGDMYEQWSETDRRLKMYGTYPNNSKYVRVDMESSVDDGSATSTLLPFGYFGPPTFRNVSAVGYLGSQATPQRLEFLNRFIKAGDAIPGTKAIGSTIEGTLLLSGNFAPYNALSASFEFPTDRLRAQSRDGVISSAEDAYFGFQSYARATNTVFDPSVTDIHRLLYSDLGTATNVPVDNTSTTYNNLGSGLKGFQYIFTLDDVTGSAADGFTYTSGSRVAGTSTSANGTYKTLLDADVRQFNAPFWGGFDGVDIQKPDPFYNAGIGTSATRDTSYAYNTIERAIDTVSDPEYIDMNLLTMPGLTNTALTERMIRNSSDRGDALAIIDLPNVYIPNHEAYNTDKTNRIGTTPVQAATNLKNRQIDSSYGATYYPWVQTRDDNGQLVWIPPTVAMMGVYASSERQSAVWFAPAGFNRGGLSQGAAGLPVINVSERLTSKERDTLYDARINPIASFPSSGIVVFGQKTLQERRSALDRINVRRLVIFLKKQIAIASNNILFEQNVQATWNNFIAKVDPILGNVRTQFGITDYKLILDETTTTPDLVDQNVLYAKIIVKPAKAIEFIAIDFVVTNSGAGFAD
jgi:hypothetical protein